MNEELARKLRENKEWVYFLEYMKGRVDEIGSVEDIDVSKVDAAVEVRARQLARKVILDIVDKVFTTNDMSDERQDFTFRRTGLT